MARVLVAGALALVLSGCATRPPAVPGDTNWAGRLWLKVASEPPQTLNVDFELRGNAHAGELRLLSPLGSTVALAQWSPRSAQLQHSGTIDTYPDMLALTQQLTGAALPLPALFDWLRGTPAQVPGWQADLRGLAQGRLQAQRQQPEPAVELRLRLLPPE